MITNIVELVTCDVAMLSSTCMTFDEVTTLNFFYLKSIRKFVDANNILKWPPIKSHFQLSTKLVD